MNEQSIYKDIALRTGGDIYVGVVGPVRSGKSTFIKKFMEELVLPNIAEGYSKERAIDELPQSAQGKTVMTTEPKFVPEDAVKIVVDSNAEMNVRLVDCVGYMHPEALGATEDGKARMVKTPWSADAMEFTAAAEFGTRKVIREHSTIGMVVTTDGTIGEISRKSYEEAEKRIISEMKAACKPFAVILNSEKPESEEAERLAISLEEEYGVPVALVNVLRLNAEDIRHILGLVLDRFPITEVKVKLPDWIMRLDGEHRIKKSLMDRIRASAGIASNMGDVCDCFEQLMESEYVERVTAVSVNMGNGSAEFNVSVPEALYYEVIGELTGFEIANDGELIKLLEELADIKEKYDKVKDALEMVNDVGYGIVMPDVDELRLEEPQITKNSGSYGVRLRASAQSIHMIRANIETEINPIVGTEQQSTELIEHIMKDFEEEPKRIWESNMFGKSLYELVNEGLHSKLEHMPDDARRKLSETLERVINEGSGGLICIIL